MIGLIGQNQPSLNIIHCLSFLISSTGVVIGSLKIILIALTWIRSMSFISDGKTEPQTTILYTTLGIIELKYIASKVD